MYVALELSFGVLRVATFTWDLSLRDVSSPNDVGELSFGKLWFEHVPFSLGTSLGTSRLEVFLWNVRFIMPALNLSLGNFSWGSFVWELSLGIFLLATLAWELWLGSFGLCLSLGIFARGISAWGLSAWSLDVETLT